MVLLGRLGDSPEPVSALRIVSPCIFVALYYDKGGNVIEDGVVDTHQWLLMRREVMEMDDIKGWSTRNQRGIFKFLRATGLDWLI